MIKLYQELLSNNPPELVDEVIIFVSRELMGI